MTRRPGPVTRLISCGDRQGVGRIREKGADILVDVTAIDVDGLFAISRRDHVPARGAGIVGTGESSRKVLNAVAA